MYTAVAAIGVRAGVGKRWEQINLEEWLEVSALVSTFRRWQVTLTHPSLPAPVYLDGDYFKTNAPNYNGALEALLTSYGDQALPTTPTGIVLSLKRAMYKDGFKAGYQITAVTHANSDSPTISLDDKPDIRLTRTNPATDYTNVFKTTLVSINGFYHQTDTDGINGIVVTDAMKSRNRCGQNQIGLYNFGLLGQITCVPLTDAMIGSPDEGKVLVDLQRDLTGKTIFLVLGGYFMVVDASILYRVAPSTYVIDFSKLDIRSRWFESTQYMDFGTMPVNSSPANATEIAVEDLLTEEFIRAYLKLSQTFFVILDKDEIFVNRQFLRPTRLPNMYVAYKQPVLPMVSTYGRHPEYWSTYEDGQWSMTIYGGQTDNYVFNTINQVTYAGGIDNKRASIKRVDIAKMYWLEIGSDV